MSNSFRRQQIAAFATGMRHQPTRPDARLWSELRGRKLGVTFRRQVPIGRYIADFLAPQVKLVVEVDGSAHRGRAQADSRRDRALQARGYRVLRLSDTEVMEQLPLAVTRVREALRAG